MEPIPLDRAALPPFLLKRREFLKGVGAGALALPGVAGPLGRLALAPGARLRDDGVTSPDHYVPVDKKLDPAWVKALFEKGTPTLRRGEQRAACAMPVGGIGCGQLYAGSDGTLRTWEIFNRHVFTGWGAKNYEFTIPPRVIEHGFAIARHVEGKGWLVRRLREEDVPDVAMGGRHPVAEFTYPAKPLSDGADAPDAIEARMEVFAPMIPLDAAAATLPVTFFRVTLVNRGATRADVRLLSWLENAVAPDSASSFDVWRRNSVALESEGTLVFAETVKLQQESAAKAPEVFADFEGDDWGAWTAIGDAVAGGPSHGAEAGQQAVAGFVGQGLVNTYRGGDARKGKLVSPEFTIHRRFINFLIGGGGHAKETCLDLIVDGNVVASATGKNREALEWANFDTRELLGKPARLEIVDANGDAWGHVNVDRIEFGDEPKLGAGAGGGFDQQPDWGQLVWIALGRPVFTDTDWNDSLEEAARRLPDLASAAPAGRDSATAARGERVAWNTAVNHPVALTGEAVALDPGAEQTLEFALVCHFPNHPQGHSYSARFPSARELALHVAKEKSRLIGDTLAWRDAWYGGSLPHWLLERLHAPVANLQTNVTQVWKNGRFWAWEGVGCCEGTCTHVWNYEHATGRLFPELARSTRELQDLGAGFHEDGLVGYRGLDVYAADGQCGTVLKCLREHQMSADDAFLRRNWPKIRKVVEYLLKRDGNDDGLLEDDQHNTYDIQFFGPNTFVGSLYLAALRAAEEMAKLVGDDEFASRCRKVFESGSRLTVERLWNGEYFVQKVDRKAHPQYQYADGCLADQLFGQGWARQVGLGDLYDREKVRRALRSVWDYCWAPDVGPQTARHLPERYFARRGEAGLFTCTWPKSGHMGEDGVRYRDEIWTGIEYQVAGHMIWEGMVEEGLAIIRGIDERYDGRVHNPWNEIECGDHYARAMASFGCYLALLGFEHDGPAGRLGFAPRMQQDRFTAAFTSATGWGTFLQIRARAQQSNAVVLQHGRLRIRELSFDLPDDSPKWSASLAHAPAADRAKPRVVAIELAREGRRAVVRLAGPIDLAAGDALHADFRSS